MAPIEFEHLPPEYHANLKLRNKKILHYFSALSSPTCPY